MVVTAVRGMLRGASRLTGVLNTVPTTQNASLRVAAAAWKKVVPFNLADIGEGIAHANLLEWYVLLTHTNSSSLFVFCLFVWLVV